MVYDVAYFLLHNNSVVNDVISGLIVRINQSIKDVEKRISEQKTDS